MPLLWLKLLKARRCSDSCSATIFGEYCALDSSERPQLLAKISKLYGESAFPANFEDAKARLMPHLIDRWTVFRTNMNLALGMAKELDDA
jgi:hypothetical protein